MTWSYRSTEYISYMEVLGAEHVPERGGAEQPGGLGRVGHVHHGGHGVEHFEVNHGVYSDSNAVFCENLQWRERQNISFCHHHHRHS